MKYNVGSLFSAIRARIIYGSYFLKGNLSFSLVLFLILPAFFRPKIDVSRPFNFYGKPCIVPKGNKQDITLSSLIHQIIGHNQYRIDLIGENEIVIDAGAHMGIFSIVTAVSHPHATIYAFEPTPSTFETLKENTKYYPNIKVFNFGLGEKRKISFLRVAHSTPNHIVENHEGENDISVEVKTIDELDLPVGFIKMDVEGYEANVIKGALETIKKYKPIFVMSAYHKPNDETTLPALLNSIIAYDCDLKIDGEKDLTCKPK